MERMKVERSIWVRAPRERVWQALTTPEELMAWLVPNLPGMPMVRGDDGSLGIQMGPMRVDLMRLEHLEPPKRARARSLPDGLITVAYALEEKDGGTLVAVEVSGFEGQPKATFEGSVGQVGAGWEKALANLGAFAEGSPLPFPQAHVAPLFGYWQEVRETFALERSIWIDAPPERVWRAVTDPAQIEGWFSPGTPWRLSALEVGGRLYVHDDETGGEKYTQVVESLDPPHRFVLRTPPDGAGKSEVTVYTVRAEGGGTRLSINHSGYERTAEASRWATMEQNTFGFGMMLQNTKAYVEGRSLPFPSGF